MKRFILAAGACALAFASVLPSFAADMPRGRYAEPAPSYFSWSGFYVGLNAGYGWGTSDWSGGVTSGSTDPAGGLFGGTVGFNVQNRAWSSALKATLPATGCATIPVRERGSARCQVAKCRPAGSALRAGALGYAFDRALFYVTAGGAFGDVQMTAGGATATVERAGLDRRRRP